MLSHGKNFKMEPGQTLVMECFLTDLSGWYKVRSIILNRLIHWKTSPISNIPILTNDLTEVIRVSPDEFLPNIMWRKLDRKNSLIAEGDNILNINFVRKTTVRISDKGSILTLSPVTHQDAGQQSLRVSWLLTPDSRPVPVLPGGGQDQGGHRPQRGGHHLPRAGDQEHQLAAGQQAGQYSDTK